MYELKKDFTLEAFDNVKYPVSKYYVQLCAYYFGLSIFQDSEETIHSAEIS